MSHDILQYLNIKDPLKEYWYADVARMVWCVDHGDGTYEEKPIRWEDLTAKGRKEHPEMKPSV